MAAFSIIKPTESGGLPLPGICKVCGSAGKESYLDTGTQENDYGAILYCVECFYDASTLFGFLHPERASELKRLAESQYLQNLSLRDRVDKLKGAIDALVRSGFFGSVDFVELDMVYLSEIIDSESAIPSALVESGESTVTESSSSEGFDSLPSNGKQFSLFDK